MGAHLIRLVAAGWGLLLATAAGGFVGANFAGLVAGGIAFATAGQRAPDMQPVQWWMHCGWLVGAGLFLFSGIVHFAKKAWWPSAAQTEDRRHKRKLAAWSKRKRHRTSSNRFRVTVDGRPCGVLGSIIVGSLGGALLGMMLGGSLLLLWFSITYSPFAPRDWVESVELKEQHVDGTRSRRVASTSHPVAMYAFFGPLAVGAAGGGLLCGAGTAFEKFRGGGADEPSA